MVYHPLGFGNGKEEEKGSKLIVVSGEIKIRPEAREAALATAREMAAATQAEDGCLSYMFYLSVTDENTVRVFEEW